MRVRKKLCLLPIIVKLAFVGGLLALAQGSALAPLITRSSDRHADRRRCLRRDRARQPIVTADTITASVALFATESSCDQLVVRHCDEI
jgi:hypothetical protein